MILAHLPAGYLFAKWVQARGVSLRGLLAAGMAGSLAPDLDMVYFYLIDGRRHHHHTYWSHYPLVWGGLLLLSLLWMFCARGSRGAMLSLIFCASGFLHLILDSLVGDIWWFAPFVDRPYSLFTVQARFSPWWLNFILDWSFLAEAAIIAAAVCVYLRSRRKAGRRQ